MHLLFLRYFIKKGTNVGWVCTLWMILRPTNYDSKMITGALTGITRHESTSIKVALQHSDVMITDWISLVLGMSNTQPCCYRILQKINEF